MSRGPGRQMRFALELLAEVDVLQPEELAAVYAAEVKRRRRYGASDLVAARRVLRRLSEMGRTEAIPQPDGRRVGYRLTEKETR